MNIKISNNYIKRIEKHNIGLVYLFGLYAENKNQKMSDIDIGIIMLNNFEVNEGKIEVYNEIYDIFTDLLPDKKIDIVFLQSAGLAIYMDAINHGQILYQYSDEFKYSFIEKIILMYGGFKPVLEEFNHEVLKRI